MWLQYRQLDRASFIADARRVERRAWLLPGMMLAMWGGPLLLAFGASRLGPPARAAAGAWLAPVRWVTQSPYVPVAVWVGLSIALIVLVWRWSSRDPRVRCPACGKSLLNHTALVVATGNCGACGSRVLSDPPAP